MHCKHKEPPPEGVIGPRVNYLSRLVRRRFNEVIAEEGLFSGQQDILFAIVDNEGVTSSQLSSMSGVSAATISVSVKRMEKTGFIIKKADDNDARIIRLYPTQRAKALPQNLRNKMDELEETLCMISELPNIKIKGLMAIPPVCESEAEARKYFAALRQSFIDIKGKKIDNIDMEILSMGMSGDYKAAIAEGSDIVRVGSAIFGARKYY